jgi:hypothetical protein
MFQCAMEFFTQYNCIRYIYMVDMLNSFMLDCKAVRVIFNQIMRSINIVNNNNNNMWFYKESYWNK